MLNCVVSALPISATIFV